MYVDDILIKLLRAENLIGDLEETFATLRRYELKLNSSKYSFGVGSGKFLSYLVIKRGIEANPDKVRALQDIRTLQNTREVPYLMSAHLQVG